MKCHWGRHPKKGRLPGTTFSRQCVTPSLTSRITSLPWLFLYGIKPLTVCWLLSFVRGSLSSEPAGPSWVTGLLWGRCGPRVCWECPVGNGEGGGFLMNSLEASRGSRYCLRGVRMLRRERREMRGEDYRGRGEIDSCLFKRWKGINSQL